MAMVRIFLLMTALHGANVALAETEVKGRPALVLDDRQVVRPHGTTGNRVKAIEAAAGAVERTNADLEMEVDALFIE